MGNSLQEQLIKAGLASGKQAKKVKSRKPRQKPKKKDREEAALSDSARSALRAMADKTERDRQLNRERHQETERIAAAAQVRQLIEQHRVPLEDGDIVYHFADGDKVRRIYVTPEVRERLSSGHLAIARLAGGYAVIPADAARKIKERNTSAIVLFHAANGAAPKDDPYAGHPVPDDLMW